MEAGKSQLRPAQRFSWERRFSGSGVGKNVPSQKKGGMNGDLFMPGGQ
jgi:hypothetical protein